MKIKCFHYIFCAFETVGSFCFRMAFLSSLPRTPDSVAAVAAHFFMFLDVVYNPPDGSAVGSN